MHTFDGLATIHSETGCCFSPDESLVLTGTAAQRDGTGGALLFFDLKRSASSTAVLHVHRRSLVVVPVADIFNPKGVSWQVTILLKR